MSALYISDLDGTLLDDAGELSAYSEAGLREMLSEGLLFTVASARSVIAIRQMMAGVTLRLPVIEFNGAFISDLQTGRHEVVNHIDPVIAEDIYRRLNRPGHAAFVSTFNGLEDRVYYGDIVNAGMRWYLDDRIAKGDTRWRHAEDLAVSLRDQVVCLTLIGRAEPLAELEAEIMACHAAWVETHVIENLYSPGWYWLTVHDRRATKDQAIERLRQMRSLGEHELVVFGDQSNDLKMFCVADEAVAVANATTELKSRASRVIGLNRDDSVVRFIQARWRSDPE